MAPNASYDINDTQGRPVPGTEPMATSASDSGNSGNSSQVSNGPGTAGSVPQQTKPGVPQPFV